MGICQRSFPSPIQLVASGPRAVPTYLHFMCSCLRLCSVSPLPPSPWYSLNRSSSTLVVCMRICARVCARARVCACAHVCASVRARVRARVCARVCTCARVCARVCERVRAYMCDTRVICTVHVQMQQHTHGPFSFSFCFSLSFCGPTIPRSLGVPPPGHPRGTRHTSVGWQSSL